MSEVDVRSAGDDEYVVTVTEGERATTHVVTGVDGDAASRGVAPVDLVAASFRFLLDREPKEAILSRFELAVISRYFPEYPGSVAGYLDG
jgi:hypothetical protein